MTAFDNAHEQIKVLVERFQKGIKHYTSPVYQEYEARQDFIDDMFIILGWDVRHREQQNPYEQEVKVEKGQRQQEAKAQKRADYAFYLGPNFKDERFFVEAKKPSVGLKNPDHYFQTIRYGWSANTPISILTDFEEFHIIDCRIKPDIRYVFNGQHREYHYTDYLDKEKFAEIYWVFSREAVKNGSLEKYTSSLPKPKGKTVQKTLFKGGYKPIDEDFLEYIDNIRADLAKAFKKNDERLNGEELTEAVQRTIDRLVFVRFLEDKLIEPENHVSEWTGWQDFVADCRKLDAKYNGIVFKKHFIDEQHFAGAEEKLFRDICSDISNLNSPYQFNYLPIHILGSIYERFLGKIVVSTAKRVSIEEKPEVRKAGGVYYTPKYIVDYIVANTVNKLLVGKTPKQISEIKFADIACGSGSFLIGVYDALLEYHKKYYNEKLKDKVEIDGRSEDFGNTLYKDGQWILTLKLKQEILLNNIYGVDIDSQAVEVTQLSLFLKMLEDETLGSTQVRQGTFFSKVLPDLTSNITCGNSLIGTDILKGQLFSFEEEKKLNPMDLEVVFAEVMRKGGFDAIVGNPPYVMLQNLEGRHTFNYTSRNFVSAKYKIDTYQLFIEKAIKSVKADGYVGFIVPNTFLKNIHAEPLRKYILETTSILEFLLFDYSVFKGASVDTLIFIFKKGDHTDDTIVKRASSPDLIYLSNIIPQNQFRNSKRTNFNTEVQNEDKELLEKIETKSGGIMKQYCDAYFGIQTFNREDFVSSERKDSTYKPIIDGSNIDSYVLKPFSEFVQFIPKAIKSGGNPKVYEQDRICIRQIGATPIATLVPGGIYTLNTVYNVFKKENVEISLKFLLAVTNSKLIKYYWRKHHSDQKGTFPKIKKEAILNIPVPSLQRDSHINLYKQIQHCAEQILNAKEQLLAAKTDRDKTFLENKSNALIKQIDAYMYEWYELTPEEISIVEKG